MNLLENGLSKENDKNLDSFVSLEVESPTSKTEVLF